MFYNELKPITVLTYSGVDEYGQLRQGSHTDRESEMYIKCYSTSNVSDPRYIDVTDIGLTNDTDITVNNEIVCGDTKYKVLYVIPTRRLQKVLLKKI